MLRQLRQRASEALSNASQIILSTSGPADVQAEALACEAVGLHLYVLVSRASDLLFNLENSPLVVATTDEWQMRGEAHLLTPAEYPEELAIVRAPQAAWCVVVDIRPISLQMRLPHSLEPGEVIDLP